MSEKELVLTNKQLEVLKEQLECDIECRYENLEEESDKEELKELLLINIEVCKVLKVEETQTLLYQYCKKDLL